MNRTPFRPSQKVNGPIRWLTRGKGVVVLRSSAMSHSTQCIQLRCCPSKPPSHGRGGCSGYLVIAFSSAAYQIPENDPHWLSASKGSYTLVAITSLPHTSSLTVTFPPPRSQPPPGSMLVAFCLGPPAHGPRRGLPPTSSTGRKCQVHPPLSQGFIGSTLHAHHGWNLGHALCSDLNMLESPLMSWSLATGVGERFQFIPLQSWGFALPPCDPFREP